jgi:hypothetical protein
MNVRIAFAALLCLLAGHEAPAQVSYGGSPLFPGRSPLKGAGVLARSGSEDVIEMPAFNLDSVLQSNARYEGETRGSFQFAYKFFTHIERGKDGAEWVLADGTRVWQAAIRSQGAYSINLLFTEYCVPEGGRLFLYNEDHSYVLGAYDYRNNSDLGLLPVQPVAGDMVIVEYSEPADAAFRGRLTIGDVNHDYRDILRGEPATDVTSGAFDCMPDVVCPDFEVDEATVRATLLVMINGNTACSGSLVNNTSDDGRPYVLTAVHCLNEDMNRGLSNYKKEWEYYVDRAGTVVVFFNYSRPVCGHSMKASEDFTIAAAYPRTIIEGKDIALLELQEKPPMHYNAYYAGWDVSFGTRPYTNIHHPSAAVKRYNSYAGNLVWTSFWETSPMFDRNSHMEVEQWTTGSTHVGSSGSPLFDAKSALLGGLSGGRSECGKGGADSFFALERGWELDDAARPVHPENRPLKTYLDPDGTGTHVMTGYDPNRQHPLVRIGNVAYGKYELVATQYSRPHSGYVFGNNNLNINEFAEEFVPEYEAELYGVYLLIPPVPVSSARSVKIRVYEGNEGPERLLATQELKPQFLDYTNPSFVLKDKNMSYVATENFVRFDEPVTINTKFFISYQVNGEAGSQFAVYNINHGNDPVCTAWINRGGDWMRSSAHSTQPVRASLAIEALLSYTNIPVPAGKTARIGYIRNLYRLLLPSSSDAAGYAAIYSPSGQLIQRLPFPEGKETLNLRQQPRGTIGIVRVVRGNEIFTGKLIY